MDGSLSAYCLATGRHLPPVSLPAAARGGASRSSQASASFVVGSSPDRDFVVSEPGWESRHLGFSWSLKYSTWVVENFSSAPLYIESHCLLQGQTLPLLVEEATLVSEGVLLQFQRHPSAPRYGNQVTAHIPLTSAGLIIGRGAGNKDAGGIPRLELDPDILTISSRQAEICKTGSDYVLLNRNPSASGRTILNGDQNFDERKLVLGDCIQIPNCDYYTFKFTGGALRHLGQGGRLQGFGLTVDVKTGRILHPVNLELRRGGFLGIIGGSGQGKSTLMNALCGIVPATGGCVSVDGLELHSPREVARAGIGYVPQDDIVHRELTVEEALYYAARLRLKATPAQTQELLEATMDTLRLTEHRRKRIANLSGGQRKRVSIASELLVSPDYIFLDEPTSGLDPQTERSLMGELSVLAQRRRIGVACTTHVLQNCHVLSHLAFISRGRLIFYGKPVDAVRFFLVSGSPEGAAKNRGENATATASGSTGSGGSHAAATASHGNMGADEYEFTEADLLGKIAHIYDIAQDATKPVQEQDRVAESWEKEYQATPGYRLPVKVTDSLAREPSQAPSRVGLARSLFLLVSRQWKILASSKLNYLFLTAQAAVIGLLISWVDANPVLQMFLSLIATLWFGCSNGATQIVAELPIFRRERLAGLGINTYLLSKFLFFTAITGLQAVILFFIVLCGSHLFHRDAAPDQEAPIPDLAGRVPDKATREFRKAFFDKEWNSLAAGDDRHDSGPPLGVTVPAASAPGGAAADFGIVGLDVDGNNKPLPPEPRTVAPQIHINPTGLHVADAQYRLLETLAWFFRVRENILDSLAVHAITLQPEQSLALGEMENGAVSWGLFMGNVIGLRLVAFLAAALVGVGLGLAVSSLVDTTTQAVMWVPLILIPQILFGSFVVIVPEMDRAVLAFSSALPSFNLQHVMDVALVYGRSVPRMTNQTRIPAFLGNPPNEKEVVEWERQQTSYDKISEVNKSWQNLAVIREWLGAREKIPNTEQPSFFVESVEDRPDVSMVKGDRYLRLQPARGSLLILACWALGCYTIAAAALYRRQTGR